MRRRRWVVVPMERTSLVVGLEGGVALVRMTEGFRAAPVGLVKVGGTYGW